MAKSSKSSKQSKQPLSTKPPQPQTTTTPPTPFTHAPQSLQPLLAPLSPKHIYLIHLDTHPKEHKRQIFLLPALLNLTITLLILLRAYLSYPTYADILTLLIGQDSPAKIDPSSSSWSFISSILARRTLTFLFDYLLLTVFLPWPARFLFGPVAWRRKIGLFQPVEIVVRKSRAWSEELRSPAWIREDDATIKTKVVPAVTPQRLQKTGYLLIDADWDLDFDAMIKAHEMVEKGGLKFEDFRQPAVVVHGGEELGWLVWKVGSENDVKRGDGSTLSSTQRDKIMMFQEKLAAMGKEDLFFRWVELIQYESTQPGGFTPERQRKAMKETQEIFENQGVDFEKFWADVGGMEGIDM
ncbi:hypothetical protein FQN52_008998 [Onygenales sp. PD_12]|nr:hypothetical protein FQN52_008998 [Onygenales sp. PD_12]KAK2802785.1 hypothetical protein FQN51_004313 [Onygenales sp. PD_10]